MTPTLSSPVEAILSTISVIMSTPVFLNENTTKAFPQHWPREQKSHSLFIRNRPAEASSTSFKLLRQMAPRPLGTYARAFEEGSIPATTEDRRHQEGPNSCKAEKQERPLRPILVMTIIA